MHVDQMGDELRVGGKGGMIAKVTAEGNSLLTGNKTIYKNFAQHSLLLSVLENASSG